MCFQFGAVLGIEPLEGSWTFLAVVAFLLIFEFFVGLLEYLVEGSTVYNQMVQKIYKELMIMGLVSFTIVMYEATVQDHSEAVVTVITAIDFNHLLLFFVAIFFVVHAIVLIWVSAASGKEYLFMFNKPVSEVISDLDGLMNNPIPRFFFHQQYIPLSKEREIVEFKLMHRLFTDTYSMSHDFNFSFYLTGCFEEYALKAMEGGMVPWFALVFLVAMNYIRIYFSLGSGCHIPTDDHATDDHSTDDHATDDGHRRWLSATETASLTSCQVDTFLWYVSACAVVLCAYLVLLMFLARLYELRMLHKVGVSQPDDYMDFLSFTDRERKRVLVQSREDNSNPHTGIPRRILKNTIQALLDEEEHDEETEVYRQIVLHVSSAYTFVIVHWLEFLGYVRTYLGTAIHTAGDAVLMGKLSFDAREGEEEGATPAPHAPRQTVMGGPTSLLAASSDKEGGGAEGGHGSGSGSLRQSLRTVRLSSSRNVGAVPGLSPTPPPGHRGSERKSVFDKGGSKTSAEHAAHAPSLAEAVRDWRSEKSEGAVSVEHAESEPTKEAPSPNVTESASMKSQSPALKAFKEEDDEDKSSVSSNSSGGTFIPRVIPAAPVGNAARSKRRASIATLHAVGTEIAIQGHPGELTRHVSRLSADCDEDCHSQNMTLVEKYKLHRKEAARRASGDGRRPKTLVNCFGLCYAKEKVKASELPSDSSTVEPLDDNSRAAKEAAVTAGCVAEPSADHVSPPSEVAARAHARLQQQSAVATPSWMKPFVYVGDVIRDAWDSVFFTGKYAITDESDLSAIFFLCRPQLFFGAVNVGIMLNCFYMGMWITNFHTIVSEYIEANATFYQCLLVVPILINFPVIAITIKICSQLNAIVNLDIKVVNNVLDMMDDMEALKVQLREKILLRIQDTGMGEKEFMDSLFEEIDVDNSGCIDPTEFRQMLGMCELRYSDERFRRLFASVDVSGDGQINKQEVDFMIFPDYFYFDDDGILRPKPGMSFRSDHNATGDGDGAAGPTSAKEAVGRLHKQNSDDGATAGGIAARLRTSSHDIE